MKNESESSLLVESEPDVPGAIVHGCDDVDIAIFDRPASGDV